MKDAASVVGRVASEGGRKCCDTCCSDTVKEHLATLIQYACTIIIALAWWELLSVGLFYRAFGTELWWMWVLAALLLILAMVVCWFTKESLAFGEDCC